MALSDDIQAQIDTWTAANDEASVLQFRNLMEMWLRVAQQKAVGIVHAELDTQFADHKASMVTLASQALADSIESQIDAWVTANDEASVLSMKSISRRWSRPSAEKARGMSHAELDSAQASSKADLDTLLAP